MAIVAEIDLAGVTLLPRPAQHEAVLRLEAAVAEIGGRLNICRVSSSMARQTPPARPAVTNAERGRG
ncbi:MAG TPA: hypothetical protein VKQ05_01870 [Gemmatimonadales bacterium]|nr:hypothetical protein [Gemmatimonadales bacterium]